MGNLIIWKQKQFNAPAQLSENISNCHGNLLQRLLTQVHNKRKAEEDTWNTQNWLNMFVYLSKKVRKNKFLYSN